MATCRHFDNRDDDDVMVTMKRKKTLTAKLKAAATYVDWLTDLAANVNANEFTFVDNASVNEHTPYTLGKQQDCVLTVTPDHVTLSSTSELH